MIVVSGEQLRLFAYALILGLALGVIYILTHPGTRVRAGMDALFALTALAASAAFFLKVCGGLVRGYQIAALLIGLIGSVRLFRAVKRRRNG